ncbi:MAG: hypothetical protein ABIX10_06125 [Acidimicrobiales bacterium]
MIAPLPGLVLLGGAGVYAVLVGAADVTFNSTPLLIGVAALAAGIVGRRQRLVPIGLTLAGWGLAVLLVRDGPLPDNRAAPAYLVGMSVGLLAANDVARNWRVPLTGALISALAGGLSFYAAYDIEALNRWPLWAAALAVWGVFEVARAPDAA